MRYSTFKYGSGIRYNGPEYIKDRTQADIAGKTPRGYLNHTDLNRIEHNCAEIADIMGICGYDAFQITAKSNWTRLDKPYFNGQMERIRANVEKLVAVYNHAIGQPVIPHNLKLTIEDINTLEESLRLLRQNFENIAHQWHMRAGATAAGEGENL